MSQSVGEEQPEAPWRRLFGTQSIPSDSHAPTGDIATWRLGGMTILCGSSGPFRLERTLEDVAQRPLDRLSMTVLLKGSTTIGAQGRSMTYGVGELVLIDESAPYVIDATETALASILVPRRAILEMRPEIGMHLVTATRAESLSAIALAQLVRTLAHNGPPSGDVADGPIRDALITLAIGAIETQGVKPSDARQDSVLHKRVRSFVLSHLAEPDLSPERIASGAGISRSSLYRAFASTGGVSRFVQNCRIDAIRALLADGSERRSITELSLAFGFTSVGHFSRVFRDRTGQSPRDFRAERRTSSAKPES